MYDDIRKVTGTGLGSTPVPYYRLPLFGLPRGVSLNTVGSVLYVADQGSNVVKALNLGSNVTTNWLGAANGLSRPVDVAVDASDNVYVLNQGTAGNGSILAFDHFGNALGTVASGLAKPAAMKLDAYGSVFVAEQGGMIQQFSGGTSNVIAVISSAGVQLAGLALFDDGTIAVSDAGNHVIWQVDPVTRAVSLLCGAVGVPGSTLGAASYARLNQPQQLARAAGNLLVAADSGNNRLVVIDRSGAVTNVLSSTNALVWYGRSGDPHGSSDPQFAPMVAPVGVALNSAGEVFSSETVYNDVRKVTGTGLGSTPVPYYHSPLFGLPRGVALNTVGSVLYVADQGSNVVKALNLGSNVTTNWLGTANGFSRPLDVAVDWSDNVYVLSQGTSGNGGVLAFDHFGNALGTVASGLAKPAAMKLDAYGSVFVAEQGGMIQQFSGGTSNLIAVITSPGVQLAGLALFDDGTIAVSDAGNHVIWQVDPVSKAVSLLTGLVGVPGSTLGAASYARLNQPQQLTRAAGNLLVAADSGNNRLVVIDRSGAVTNVLNSTNALVWYGRSSDPHGSSDPQFAPMVAPVGVALNSAGEVFSSETVYNDVRKVTGTGLGSTPVPYYHSPLFGLPRGVALNTVGSVLYVADQGSNVVKALNLGSNVTTNWLGTANGLSRPADVAVDASDNVYVLSQGTSGDGGVLAFDHFGNALGTVASGLAKPAAMKLDAYGSVFVAEQGGMIQQFSGGTSNLIAVITNPGVQLAGLALFDDGTIAVSDAGNHVIWQVDPVSKAVSLLTGLVGVPGSTLGAAGYARLNQPQQLARAAGNLLVAADAGNNRLVVIDRSGAVTNVLNSTNALVWYGRSGDPHGSTDPQFAPMAAPVGVALNSAGEVFSSETVYDDIRKVTGTGLGSTPVPYYHSPLFGLPRGVALNTVGSLLYVADQGSNVVKALNLGSNVTTNWLGTANGLIRPVDVAVDASDNVYVLSQGTSGNGTVLQFDSFGNALGTVASGLAKPTAMKLDAYGSVFVAEQGGMIQQFSGGTSNVVAVITSPGVQLAGLALFDDGTIAVSDAGNHVIWQVDPVTKAVSLLTGSVGAPGSTLGSASYARLNQPQQLARAAGNLLVAADSGNNRLVVIDRSGAVTNVLNSTNALVWYGRSGDPHGNSDPQFAPMVAPVGVALNSVGEVFSSETVYNDIRKVTGTGLGSTPVPYYHSPLFGSPRGVALNTVGSVLYVADQGSNVVKALNLGSNVTTNWLGAANGLNHPVDVALDTGDNLYVLNQGTGGNGSILAFDHFGNALGTVVSNLTKPTAFRNVYGGFFIVEQDGAIQHFISGTSNTIATITNAGVQLAGLALFDDGTIVVSDAGNHVIWQVNPVTRSVGLLTGALGVPGSTLWSNQLRTVESAAAAGASRGQSAGGRRFREQPAGGDRPDGSGDQCPELDQRPRMVWAEW